MQESIVSSSPIPNSPSNLSQSNTLNLHGHTFGQLIHSDTAAGRLVREELLISGIHLGKGVHSGQEDVYLDDFLEGGAGGKEDGGEVLDAESVGLAWLGEG